MKLNQISTAIRLIAIPVIAVCLSFTNADARKIPGQVVDRDGNVKEVTLRVPFKFLRSTPDFESLQARIVYFDASGQRIVLRPDDAREISFVFKGQEVRMLSVLNTIGAGAPMFGRNKNIFLHLKVDGKLKLFNYYETQTTGGGVVNGVPMQNEYTQDYDVLQLADQEPMQPRGLSFRKDMMEYLADCPIVTNLIESRDLKRRDTELIVMMYNDKCGD